MADPNSSFSELITSTLRKRRKTLADNVTNHNALLRRLRERGNTQLVDGGRSLVEEVEYAENDTFMYYEGYEQLDITPSTIMSAAEYDWAQWAVTMTIDGRTQRQNSGESEMIRLIARRLDNLEKTAMNNISTGIYSDASDAKGIDGLQYLVADDPDANSTVGGINPLTYSFWRNYSSGDVTLDSTTIQTEMQDAWIQLVRGADRPRLIVADATNFNLFWNSLLAIQRIAGVDEGASGFNSLAFHGPGGMAPVMYDDTCPSSHMYLLNTDYIFWRVHRAANFALMEEKSSVNQDAIVRTMIGMGQMTLSNRSLQGVIYT